MQVQVFSVHKDPRFSPAVTECPVAVYVPDHQRKLLWLWGYRGTPLFAIIPAYLLSCQPPCTGVLFTSHRTTARNNSPVPTQVNSTWNAYVEMVLWGWSLNGSHLPRIALILSNYKNYYILWSRKNHDGATHSYSKLAGFSK